VLRRCGESSISLLVLYNGFMKSADNLQILPFDSQRSWEAWLKKHHTDPNGIWLKIAKKDTGISTVSYSEALDGAICYGWIDGQKAPFDDKYWLQKFTPRRPKGGWSKINRERAQSLIAQGRMKPAGMRHIESAKADGRWDSAYDSQSKITIPDDLQAELDKNSKARIFFAKLSSANRYAILYRVQTAKKPETRAARIKKFIQMLAKHETIHPQ
jgi:uncharacterized protein YdeI (YjbR/CyaY-like superfamily)